MTRPTASPLARRPGGFTLVEILIVVVLLGLLTSLLVIGIKHLTDSSKRQQTRALLQQAQALYAQWQVTARQPFPPSVMPAPGNVTAEMANASSMGTPVGDRYGAAVWFTRDVMSAVRSVPANAAALGKMPPSSLMTFPASQGLAAGATFPAPYTPTDYAANSNNLFVPFGAADYGRVYRKTSDSPATWYYYDCIQANGGPVSTTSVPPMTPPNPAYWFLAYPVFTNDGTVPADNKVPVLLDAWGNPIIFVPGGTLGNATGAMSGLMKSGIGTAAVVTQARSPDGRGFFASAGPDGDFSTGDDNVYSFEK